MNIAVTDIYNLQIAQSRQDESVALPDSGIVLKNGSLFKEVRAKCSMLRLILSVKEEIQRAVATESCVSEAFSVNSFSKIQDCALKRIASEFSTVTNS